MKKILLKRLELKNFMGIKEFEIDFEKETNIGGENESGKTTLVDAFNYLLFGKDSLGRDLNRANHNIKTIDKNNNVIHGLEHSVKGIFDVDGKQVSLMKIYKEDWVTRNGSTDKELKGHTTERFINDIPKKAGEYDKFINELIDEDTFKLITNPLAFSELHWKDMRNVLFEMTGNKITKEDVIKQDQSLVLIAKELEEKTEEELEAQIKYQLKELSKEYEYIPVKIDTLNSTLKEVDLLSINKEITKLENELNVINDKIKDKSKVSDEKLSLQEKLFNLKSKLEQRKQEIRQEINSKDQNKLKEVNKLENDMNVLTMKESSLINELGQLERELPKAENNLEDIKKKYNDLSASEFQANENELICPTCKRELEDSENKLKEMQENFNKNKVENMKSLLQEHEELNKRITDIKNTMQVTEEQIEYINSEYKKLQSEHKEILDSIKTYSDEELIEIYQEDKECLEIAGEIGVVQLKVNEIEEIDVTDLENERDEINNKIKLLAKETQIVEHNKEIKSDIKALMDKEKSLANEINSLKGKEKDLKEYIRVKSELIEKKINDNFEMVSFKLFNKQINGGIEETCEPLVKGIPFSKVNTAGKVQAGLDIINSLNDFYEVKAPIFIDNRESITNLIETDNQIINLYVVPNMKLSVLSSEEMGKLYNK